MVAVVVQQPWIQDLPVCLPARACVDQSPLTAPLMTVTSALTPVAPLIAAVCVAAVGAGLVLVVVGLRQQWRAGGAPGWLVALVAALLLFGVSASWTVRGRLAVIALVYSDVYGQPAAPVPQSLIGAWPAVLAATSAMTALGVAASIAVLGAALVRRRRAGSIT